MRRFFLVVPFIFLLGFGLPLLAANTGGEKHACREEQVVNRQDSLSLHQCADRAEEKPEQVAVKLFLPVPELPSGDPHGNGRHGNAWHGDEGNQEVPLGPAPVNSEKVELKAGKPVPKLVSPAKNVEKKEETSGKVLSFNFLYYLFYKFSLSEFF